MILIQRLSSIVISDGLPTPQFEYSAGADPEHVSILYMACYRFTGVLSEYCTVMPVLFTQPTGVILTAGWDCGRECLGKSDPRICDYVLDLYSLPI